MADLNRQLIGISQKTARLKDDLVALLREYEGIYHEANGVYLTEKVSSNNGGLEDFYILLQTIRRNRDVVGSVLKGLSNIRPTEKFKFIEEEIQPKKLPPKKKRNYTEVSSAGVDEAPPDLADLIMEDVKVPEVTNG
ncbi:MAG: hypothetical protein IMZ64_08085 [Bacteroidetes bacterium]|nr:hypothetical protein [Bacteroidota bacterium]